MDEPIDIDRARTYAAGAVRDEITARWITRLADEVERLREQQRKLEQLRGAVREYMDAPEFDQEKFDALDALTEDRSDGSTLRGAMEEPKKLYSVVRDKDGELWMRGRQWWYWQNHRGVPGGGPGKLHWDDLEREYGPLTTDRETERIQAKGIFGGRARD